MSRRRFLQSSAYGACLLSGSISLADEQSAAGEWPDHFFLSENFAPVHEEVTVERLPVVGKIPAELDGMYLRNGPNPQFPPLGNYHWFDGDGMVHGVRFQDGRASYRNRYVRTEGWEKEHAAGKALWKGFADPVEIKEVAAKLVKGEHPFKNTANTALVWHHGKLLALWELGFPYELSLPELKTEGSYNFGVALRHAMTAHPKIDVQTGDMMTIGYSPLPPFLQYSVFARNGRLKQTTPIPVRRPVFMHDFAITENYSVFLELPAVFDPYSQKGAGGFVRYSPELGARLGILPRHEKGESIRWFEIETCFVYHILNAFEDEQTIHLYACRMPNYPKAFGMTATVSGDDFAEIFGHTRPVMYHWACDLQTGTVREEALDQQLAEHPRVNDRLVGRPTRYGYAVGANPDSSVLLVYDLKNGGVQRHEFGKGRIATETVFAPRPGANTQDEGWLVTYVFDRGTETSECLVLDARDVTPPPVARIRLPPTAADAPRLEAARMSIAESLRLYPPVWIVARDAVEEDEIDGYRIPARSSIAISQYVTHRHPEFWEQPDVFDPERFSEERSAGRPKGCFCTRSLLGSRRSRRTSAEASTYCASGRHHRGEHTHLSRTPWL